MFGPVTSSANKIGARNRTAFRSAGVDRAGGGAGAGRIGAQLALAGLDVAQVVRVVENQGLGGSRSGGVASSGVASLAVLLRIQGLGARGRQIASFATGPRGRVPAAAGVDRARPAGGGVPPHGGAGRQLHPRSAWRRSPEKARSMPPFGAVKAQQGLKNRGNIAAAHGVGGSQTLADAGVQSLKRLNLRGNSRPDGLKWGRGVSSPAHLWRGKVGSVCGGLNRVN